MRTVTRSELQRMRKQGKPPTVVNVLPESEFRKERIPDTHNVPLDHDDFVDRIEKINGGKDATVVVYCASSTCDASDKAAERLEKAGFQDVVDFEGGTADWRTGGLAVEGVKA